MIRVFVVRFNSWDFLSCLATQGKSLFTWQTVALLETKGIAQYWWGHKPRAPHRPRLPHWSLFAAEKLFSTKCIWVLQKTPSSVWFWNVWPSAFSRSYQLPEFDVIRGCFHTKRERERETKKTSRGSSSSSLTTGVNENHLSLIQGGFYWQSVWVCFQEHDLQQQQPPVNSLTVCLSAYVSLCPSVNGTASSSPIESPLQIYRSRQKITLVGHSRPVTTAEIWTGKWEFQKWP